MTATRGNRPRSRVLARVSLTHARTPGSIRKGAAPALVIEIIVSSRDGSLTVEATSAREHAISASARPDDAIVRDFLADAVERSAACSVRASTLYLGFRRWCEARGSDPPSRSSFGRTMTRLGIPRRKASVVVYAGLSLRDDASRDPSAPRLARSRPKVAPVPPASSRRKPLI